MQPAVTDGAAEIPFHSLDSLLHLVVFDNDGVFSSTTTSAKCCCRWASSASPTARGRASCGSRCRRVHPQLPITGYLNVQVRMLDLDERHPSFREPSSAERHAMADVRHALHSPPGSRPTRAGALAAKSPSTARRAWRGARRLRVRPPAPAPAPAPTAAAAAASRPAVPPRPLSSEEMRAARALLAGVKPGAASSSHSPPSRRIALPSTRDEGEP